MLTLIKIYVIALNINAKTSHTILDVLLLKKSLINVDILKNTPDATPIEIQQIKTKNWFSTANII